MALFDFFMGTFQNGVFLQCFDGFFLFDTTQTGVWVFNTATEIYATLDFGYIPIILTACTITETSASTASAHFARKRL